MDKKISNIVFTKNRPLQLHGYLESLREFLPSAAIQTYILCKPELFDTEYESCFRSFPDCTVIRETNFHKDFMQLFKSLTTEYILFGIDDLAYFDRVELSVIEKTFSELGKKLFGFSLRLDKRQMPEDFAANNVRQEIVDGQTVYTVDWIQGQTPNTRYPFELCATIYRTEDIRRLFAAKVSRNRLANRFLYPGSTLAAAYGKLFNLRKLYKHFGFFHNPNTLESWCCRYILRHPKQFGNLLAYQKICATAIQGNTVSISTLNEVHNTAQMTVEILNEKYKQGWRLDIDWLEQNKPEQTHSGKESFHLTKRLGNECRV